jgi:hypothetical protein
MVIEATAIRPIAIRVFIAIPFSLARGLSLLVLDSSAIPAAGFRLCLKTPAADRLESSGYSPKSNQLPIECPRYRRYYLGQD